MGGQRQSLYKAVSHVLEGGKLAFICACVCISLRYQDRQVCIHECVYMHV